ncbi:MAG: hypothetical protein CSB44_06160 [Gammaproteobacteria bacterium]|nr:MAG: hypothetical protein CSB44_06160 [Gammaproteobacteria bacterium]
MRMLNRNDLVGTAGERVATKDENLTYRACSLGFARSIGRSSPDDVVGRTDFELFPGHVARAQMALDSRTIYSGHSGISVIELPRKQTSQWRTSSSADDADTGERVMIVRNPVLSSLERSVSGIDIRLLGTTIGQGHGLPRLDQVSLLSEAVEGTLILARQSILFADDAAARSLGFESPRVLIESGRVGDIFTAAQIKGMVEEATKPIDVNDRTGRQRVTVSAKRADGRDLRLLTRVVEVQWGVTRALLLCFVDVAAGASNATESLAQVVPMPGTAFGTAHLLRQVCPSEHHARARKGPVLSTGTGSEATRSPVPLSGTDAETAARIAARAAAECSAAERSADARAVAGRGVVRFGSGAELTLSSGDLPLPASSDVADSPSAVELQAARINVQRYRHFASAAADFFWETDRDLRFRVVSEGLVRVLGIDRERIIGHTLRQLLDHPNNVNDKGFWDEHLAALDERRAFRDFEFRWAGAGETRVIRYSGIPVLDQERQFAGFRGVGCDVTTSVRLAEATAYHANHDSLTSLVNRRHFEHLVSESIAAAGNRRESHVLCYFDLDNFKVVNDTCGHQAGDELLRQLAQLFESLVRKSDVLARVGGDEFAVYLYNCSVAEALKLANQLRHEVENFQFLWGGNRFQVGLSIGLVVADDRWENVQSLFSAADSACYIAKDEGRNRVVVYREGEGNHSNRKVVTRWVEEINAALEDNRLCLAAQKIMPLNDQLEGDRYEMLLRLRMPDGRLVAPKTFLPSAERYGLMRALDERALELTLRWLTADAEREPRIRHVSLNLSASSFTDEEFTSEMLATIERYGIAFEKLCFELTETATIANLSSARAFMETVTAKGCRIGIDDFGSGLSSIAYVRTLPIDFLKIDGLLVRDILEDPTDYTMVKAINELSKSLGKRTVAEFIESPRHLSTVRDLGIDFAQGLHLGKPELLLTDDLGCG